MPRNNPQGAAPAAQVGNRAPHRRAPAKKSPVLGVVRVEGDIPVTFAAQPAPTPAPQPAAAAPAAPAPAPQPAAAAPAIPRTPPNPMTSGQRLAMYVMGFVLILGFLGLWASDRPSSGGTTPTPRVQAPAPDLRSPFLDSAPPGHHVVGATKGKDGKSCEERGGKIVPDMTKDLEKTGKGYRRPNKCTADT